MSLTRRERRDLLDCDRLCSLHWQGSYSRSNWCYCKYDINYSIKQLNFIGYHEVQVLTFSRPTITNLQWVAVSNRASIRWRFSPIRLRFFCEFHVIFSPNDMTVRTAFRHVLHQQLHSLCRPTTTWRHLYCLLLCRCSVAWQQPAVLSQSPASF